MEQPSHFTTTTAEPELLTVKAGDAAATIFHQSNEFVEQNTKNKECTDVDQAVAAECEAFAMDAQNIERLARECGITTEVCSDSDEDEECVKTLPEGAYIRKKSKFKDPTKTIKAQVDATVTKAVDAMTSVLHRAANFLQGCSKLDGNEEKPKMSALEQRVTVMEGPDEIHEANSGPSVATRDYLATLAVASECELLAHKAEHVEELMKELDIKESAAIEEQIPCTKELPSCAYIRPFTLATSPKGGQFKDAKGMELPFCGEHTGKELQSALKGRLREEGF
jgi:hypothetical protein